MATGGNARDLKDSSNDVLLLPENELRWIKVLQKYAQQLNIQTASVLHVM